MEDGRKTAFLRVYSGRFDEGDSLTNVNRGKDDRVGRIYRLHADHREQLKSASAGDIVAVVGLRSAHTGETYAKGIDVRLEAIESYAPVITLALEPRNADEGKVLDEALARYTEEDPTLLSHFDEETGMRTISGMGELHLDVTLERMRREYHISPRVGAPEVIMRETITGTGEGDCVFDRELGKVQHFGHVSVSVAPRPRGAGNTVKPAASCLRTKSRPRRSSRRNSWPQPWKAPLTRSRAAISRATPWWMSPSPSQASNGATALPLSRLPHGRCTGPEAGSGRCVPRYSRTSHERNHQLSRSGTWQRHQPLRHSRRQIDEMEDNSGQKVVHGTASLRKLFGFSTKLRSATQGRAGLVMSFSRFDRA